jgi:hypothetical protein
MTAAIALDKKKLWKEINREERAKKRALLVELRGQIREARARLKEALLAAKERCRSERLAARERARTLRLRALQELKEAVVAERAAARQTCSVKIGEARAIRDDIERARAKHAAEREYQRDLRRIEAANRQRRKEHPHATHIERRAESDDEVRSNISSDLIPLFEKVKRGIKGTPRMSRTEAFLYYVEQHPEAMLEAIDSKTDALVRELELRSREAARHDRKPRTRGRHAVRLADAPF